MRKYIVRDKANDKVSIFLLVKDEIFNAYRFVDLTDCTIVAVTFKTVSMALNWLDIGFEWEVTDF